MTDPPMYRRDKHGRGLDAYPDRTEFGYLLGINAFGNATYGTETEATLAALNADGDLRVPVRERWIARQFPLSEAGFTPAEHVQYVADEMGEWRSLTAGVEERIEAAGYDPDELVSDCSYEADLERLLAGIEAGDGTAREASGALRQYALDHPAEVVPVVPRLLDVVQAGIFDDAGGFETVAVAADMAAVVARATRAAPEAIAAHLDQLVAITGREWAPAGDNRTLLYLVDTLDVLGRNNPEGIASTLTANIETGDDHAVATLNAIYRLEHRYSTGRHPLLEAERLRGIIEAAAERASGELRDAAREVDTIHGFHG